MAIPHAPLYAASSMGSNRARCAWAAGDDMSMITYHDEEWGVPSWDDRHLFEMLTL